MHTQTQLSFLSPCPVTGIGLCMAGFQRGGRDEGCFVTKMKTLPLEFTKGGFQCRQLARSGRAAIYEQTKDEMVAYEVVVIRNHNGRVIAGQAIPPSEYMPSPEEWGSKGWTYTDKRVAWAAYLGLAEKLRREAA